MVEWLESYQVITCLPCPYSLCMVVFIQSLGIGAAVGAHVAPGLTLGPYTSLRRGRSMPRGLGTPVLTLQGSGEAEIVPDGAQGSGEAKIVPWASGGQHRCVIYFLWLGIPNTDTRQLLLPYYPTSTTTYSYSYYNYYYPYYYYPTTTPTNTLLLLLLLLHYYFYTLLPVLMIMCYI
jgi:hypothetical protein